MIHFYKPVKWFMVTAVVSVLLWGCGGIPSNHPDLLRAQSAFKDAQTQAGVSENAPVELYDAEQALRQAEGAENVEDLKHLSYLAERRSQIAVAAAAQRAAKKETEKLSKEKDKILLDARGAEIEKKASEVERARTEVEKARAEAALAAARSQELEKELSDLNAKMTDRGYVLTLGDVLFEFNKAELMPGAYRTMEKLTTFMDKHPERSVLIEGYTDSIGSSEYNLELSQRRADAVRIALIERGIEIGRILTKGYGKDYPVASNATEAGRQQNRRVEIVILDAGVRPESKFR